MFHAGFGTFGAQTHHQYLSKRRLWCSLSTDTRCFQCVSNVGHFVSGDVGILVSTNFLSLGFESLVSSMQSGQCVQPADLTNWYCFRFEYNRQVVALNMPIHALVVW